MRVFAVAVFMIFIWRFSYAQPGLQKFAPAISTGAQFAAIDSLNNLADRIFLSLPDSAHKIAANALILSEKAGYELGKGRSFLNLGRIYWSQSYYPISLFYLKSALNNLPKNNTFYLSEAYRALGRTYADLKTFKQAISDLDTSLYYSGKDIGMQAEVYSERAYIDNQLGKYAQAIKWAQYSLKLNKIVKAENHIAVLYGRLASIYLRKRNFKVAVVFIDKAFEMSIKTNNKRLRAYTYVQYAVADNATGKYAEAISYAENGIALAGSIGIMDAETRAFDVLTNTYELQHQYIKAINCQKKFSVIRDSLSNIAKLKTVFLVQNYYDLNAKMNSVTLLAVNDKLNKAKIKSQHAMIRVLLASVAILMVILSATYYFYKQKKSLSNKLEAQRQALLDQKLVNEVQTANLQKVNNLKDKLFAVIGHDLRSPVANLTSIIEMFEDGYLTGAEVHALMKNINPVVKGVELTLSNLVEWAGSQIKGISVKPSNLDIFLLGNEIEQTFVHALQLKNLAFISHVYPGQAAIADENHLKVVLRNLVSNAIKFTPANGSITLGAAVENNELVISVKDSGKGMSEEEINKLFFINTHFSNSGTSGEKGTGIGLLLCKELVELNGGKLNVTSKSGKGSTFYFNLPLVKTYAQA